jgi:guanine nucleotide-binding protein G(I)/G(S)/G(T) subunit beta-1
MWLVMAVCASISQVMRATRELAAHDGYLSCCRFVDQDSILTSSGDSTCIFWDVEMGVTKAHFTDHMGDVMSVSILPHVDKNVFISGSCDSLAKVHTYIYIHIGIAIRQ